MNLFRWLSKSEPGPESSPEAEAWQAGLQGRVIEVLRAIYDPEIPVNIYELGLVYELGVDAEKGLVRIRMTLTAPGCPVAQTFPQTVADAVSAVEGVNDVQVELVWEPPWSVDMMSEAARLQLGML